MNDPTLGAKCSLVIQIAEELSEAPVLELMQSQLEACLSALACSLPDDCESQLRGEICVRLCDADESRRLNESYRQRDNPTNVLSFGAVDDDASGFVVPPMQGGLPAPPLGDLAICWPLVQQEAEQQNKTQAHHLSHLFIHGALHLLGFDHERSDQAEVMEQIECAALAQIDIEDPYLRHQPVA